MQWFEREFRFPFATDIYPSLVERLAGLLPRVRAKVDTAPAAAWIVQRNGRWSAQENIGHLADLESLWQGRLDDFDAGAEILRAADLDNRKTHDANHNRKPLSQVVEELATAREHTLTRLAALPPEAFDRASRHPRLDQPMRFVDHLYFVAEHDDHHLARITAILRTR